MHNKKKKAWKEITKDVFEQLVISFFFASLIFVLVYFLFGSQINTYLSLVNMITLTESDVNIENEKVSFNAVSKRLNNRPLWGNKFATLEIPDINLVLPVYHGDTLDILKYGVGHFSGSLFPGEGGTIILDAHNTRGFFYHLPDIKMGSLIYLKTDYGVFTYELRNTKVIDDTSMNDLPIQYDEEILMMYTCYPVNTIGHKNHRYVVYAYKVGESHEE